MSQPNNNNGDEHKFKKIFVGGLAWSVTTDGLRSFFQENFGEVLEANVVSQTLPDGNLKSKGYGFVTFRDAESANRACQHPPEIAGRQTNVNLAYLDKKNNHNHSNQTGLLQQAGPSHQYQHGSLNQMAWHPYQNDPFNKMAWHQYQNGWFNQVAWHPYPYTNAHFPRVYWDSSRGAYRHMHDFPHYPCSSNMHWHQTDSVGPPGMPQPPTEPRITEVPSTTDGERNDKNEDVDTEGVDQQNGKDQDGDINGQENGIEQDVNTQGEKIVIETGREETSENTPQENGLDHEDKTQHMEAGLIAKKDIDENA